MPEIEKIREDEEDKPSQLQKKTRNFLNKVVIRKLPPTLNAESFVEFISPLPDFCEFYFVPADWSLGAEATSRAYIEFKNEEDVSFCD
jgi:regulator of nonsense transcripts 3